MTRRLLPGLLILLGVLVAAAPAVGAPAVGVTLNPGPGGEAEAYEEFLEAGSDAIEAPQPWSELEPRRGHLHLGDVAAIVAALRSDPTMRVMAIPAAVETTLRSVPPDLRGVAWDSPRMIDRYRRLLRRLTPHLSRQVRYLSIANEADTYFSLHPGELPAFLRFARAEIAEAHRLAPWVKVGVTVTYGGLTANHPFIARTLARLGEATIVTYYPLVGDYRMRPPRAPLHDLPQMVRIAAGRPLVVQEAGYSSARRLGASPAAQARFVHNVFAALEPIAQAIPFLSFYELHDLPAPACRSRSTVVAFLCSLGLRGRDGLPKPAWEAFLAGARALRTADRGPSSFSHREPSELGDSHHAVQSPRQSPRVAIFSHRPLDKPQGILGSLRHSKASLISMQQLRCFCATAEQGSFTAAASALGVSQPAVAEQVRRLEQTLGVDLFVRAGRGVVVTAAGSAFAGHAEQSLRAVEDATDSVGALARLITGTVAIGVFGEPSAWRLDVPLVEFLGRHPGVSARLVGRNSSTVVDAVRSGELEAGIVLLPIDDNGLEVRPTVRDEVLYVSATAERTEEPATIERLAEAPLVFYDAESADRDPIRRQLAERAQARGLRLRVAAEVELKDIAFRLVAAGVGDTYVPTAFTAAPYFPVNVHTASFSPALHDTFAVVTRPGRRLSAGVDELLAALEAHMRECASAASDVMSTII